ncbi:MAG: heavy-metal-associated domain-containing protein [Niabella sp.]
MENRELKFKTNINCSGCVATVKPHLDEAAGIGHWEVDTANKDKILTVKPVRVTEQQVIETVQKAGFKIELIHS